MKTTGRTMVARFLDGLFLAVIFTCTALWIFQPPLIARELSAIWNAIANAVFVVFLVSFAALALWQLLRALRPADPPPMLHTELANLNYSADAPVEAPNWRPNSLAVFAYAGIMPILAVLIYLRLDGAHSVWVRLAFAAFFGTTGAVWELYLRKMRRKSVAR